MGAHKNAMTERQKLETLIGRKDVIARPADLLKGVWDAHVQADVIVSRVRCSLREGTFIFKSNSDEAAALKLHRSTLGYQLRQASHHPALLIAAKVLADEAGINPQDVHLQKDIGLLWGQKIFVVLPDESSAKKLLDHVQLPKLGALQPA